MAWRDISFAGSPLRRQIRFEEIVGQRGLLRIEKIEQPNIWDCLEVNKVWLNADRPSSKLMHSNYVKVASIPLWLLEKWKAEEGIDFYRWNDEDKARLMKKLNDFHEWGHLRTAPGQI